MALQDPIETTFVTYATALATVESAYDHEPKDLPSARSPVVTLLQAREEKTYEELGWTHITFEWEVRLYANTRNYKTAQRQLQEATHDLLRIPDNDYTLGGATVETTMEDPGGSPDFEHRQGWALKVLILRGTVKVQP